MNGEEVITKLRQREAALKGIGIRRLFLFGSMARGDARPESDVDLFLDYDPDLFGLMDLVELIDSTSRLLGRKADVMTRDSIDPRVRPNAERDAVRVF